jgi:dienelactone hydrolase
MAFIWAAKPGSVVANTVVDDPNLTLAAYYDGIELARVSITRTHVPPDYQPEFIYTPDRIGYFYPPVERAAQPAPGILLLGGEEGGVPPFSLAAALLAARGFAVLHLGYFRVGSLPATLERIPLEYFGAAISWLRTQRSISADRIGVLGCSRGGELALLLGAYYPELSSVVSVNGSGLVHAGMGRNYSHSMASAWSWQGEELPYWIQGFPPERAFESTQIPVERTSGPILLVSGDADEIWLSTRLARVAWDRLQGSRRPWNDQFLQYPGAGHEIGTPYIPMAPSVTSFIPGKQVGGTVQANHAASVNSWQAILQHFATSLRATG